MDKKYIITYALVVWVQLTVFGQEKPNNDNQEIITKVEEYFEGYTKGDSTMLKEVFHKDFRLSWKDPWQNKLAHVDRSGLFKFFNPQWSNLEIETKIEEVTVAKNSAYCRALVTLKGIVVWTDHINLLKLAEDRWWIISKVSEGKIIK